VTPTAASAKASWASKAERASESRLAGGGMNAGEESLRNFEDFAIGKMGIASRKREDDLVELSEYNSTNIYLATNLHCSRRLYLWNGA